MTQPTIQDNAPMPAAAGSIRACPQCGTTMQTGAELAGFDVQCPACGTVVPPEAQPAQTRRRLHPDLFAGWGVSAAVHFFLILSLGGVTWLSDAGDQKVPDEKPVGLVTEEDKGPPIDNEPPKDIDVQGTATEFQAPSFSTNVSTTPIANVVTGSSPAPSRVDALIGLDMASGGSSSAPMQGNWSDFGTGAGQGGGEGGGWDSFVQGLRRRGLDIVLTFDSTGSMGGEITAVKRQIVRIGQALLKLIPKARISICTYRDHGDTYVVKGLPLTSDLRLVDRCLAQVGADGGGDGPEAVQEGLRWAMTNNRFRPNARKVILLFGDAPPHREDQALCERLAATFRRQHKGIVSTVTCSRGGGGRKLPEFIQIAEAGGGQAFLSKDSRLIVEELIVLVFGPKHRAKVKKVFGLGPK